MYPPTFLITVNSAMFFLQECEDFANFSWENLLTYSTCRVFLTGWSMSKHEQPSMLLIKVLFFFLALLFILMGPLANPQNIWTYAYAR